MQKTVIALLFIFTVLSVYAQNSETVYEKPAVPLLPEIMGQGGSCTAIAEGHSALYSNPAGFASGKTEITIITANPWIYMDPETAPSVIKGIADAYSGAEKNEAELIGLIEDQSVKNGFGFGASAEISYVGSGLGIGIFAMTDVLLYGNSTPDIKGDVSFTAGAVGGYAVPIEFAGMVLKIGGDVRPMVRLRAPIPDSEAAGMILSIADSLTGMFDFIKGLSGYYGTALALDLGAQLEIGDFSIGLSVRDLFGTRFFYKEGTVEKNLKELAEGSFPMSSSDDTIYVIPMDISLGAAWHPDLGEFSGTIDPKIHLDLKDPVAVIRDEKSPLMLLHVGGEVTFFKFLNVWAGLNQGFITFGTGIDIPFFHLSIAAFSEAIGQNFSDGGRSGITAEIAIRL